MPITTTYNMNGNNYLAFFYLIIDQGLISSACLHAAFTNTDPRSERRHQSHQRLFCFWHLFEFCVKAARKMLMKLTADKLDFG